MKSRALTTIAILTAVLLLGSTGLQAQERLLFRVNIPFEFVAGGTHLPAGQYLAFHTSSSMIQLVEKDGRATAWVAVKASPVVSEGTTNQIVFNRYGQTYFLAKVKTGDDQQVHECYKCRNEQALAAQYRPSDVKTVALNATQEN